MNVSFFGFDYEVQSVTSDLSRGLRVYTKESEAGNCGEQIFDYMLPKSIGTFDQNVALHLGIAILENVRRREIKMKGIKDET